MSQSETIAAIATPPGRGGVGIIRISGPVAASIGLGICGQLPEPGSVQLTSFKDAENQILDQGMVLRFIAPRSFTGEDVIELQGHGGPVVMDMLLSRCMELGARLARPGEFSERAFLNDKIDLAQAEAIADLIDSASQQAARGAMRSLQGEFSERINIFQETLTELRAFVEAAIDFPEEEIDFISESDVAERMAALLLQLQVVREKANQGAILRDGMTIVLAGAPNAGKSSLMNMMTGRDTSIVTHVAGTTRDTIRELVHIDGMPIHFIDTAGIRDTNDIVELQGVERARKELGLADEAMIVVDTPLFLSQHATMETIDLHVATLVEELSRPPLLILNKIDLLDENQTRLVDGYQTQRSQPSFAISAKTGRGLTELKAHLKSVMGFSVSGEGVFTARRRHLDALDRAAEAVKQGYDTLLTIAAGELLAEDLRIAQSALSEITGEFTSDDLLGVIFSSFCIGK